MARWNLPGLETGRKKFGFFVLLAGAMVPALSLAGFTPDWDVLPLYQWLCVAAVFGATGGAIYETSGRRIAAVVGGSIAAAGMAWLLPLYVDLRGADSYYRIELALPITLGALPGFLLYRWLLRRTTD
jgi:hypothetical protein